MIFVICPNFERVKHTVIIALIALAIIAWSRDHFFFWDTVQLTSKHAHWFFEHDFRYFFLPEAYDSGHPPFWGMYHALLWKLFGKRLIVSHLGIFPFLFGGLYFMYRNAYEWTKDNAWSLAAVLLLVADPVYLTQATLVSPDIALVCFFLMAVYGLHTDRRPMVAIASIGLAWISLRGMMSLAGLALFVLWQYGRRDGWRRLVALLPGAAAGIAFLTAHYLHSRWIGFHADSPWSPSFALVDIKGFFKNIIVWVWRMTDFGRVFLWLLLAAMAIRYRQVVRHPYWKLAAATGAVLLGPFLLFKGLNGMRYLLPVFITIDLIFLTAVFRLREAGYPRRLAVWLVALVALVSGHSWRYPPGISVSWDTTLRHAPYYTLRRKMLRYMDAHHIPLEKTATAFPNTASREIIDLDGRKEAMTTMDDPRAEYYFISNIYNDIKHQIPLIERRDSLAASYARGGIYVKLYRRKHRTD